MIKAVLYARVSSDRQEREGFSIPAQIKLLKKYAGEKNIQIVAEFVESETAKKSGRKQFSEMVKFLKKNPSARSILVEKTDRLYRNIKDWVTLDDIEGLEIHFVKEGNILSENSKSQDKFVHGFKVLMAKNYIDNLSEEIRKGLNEKCEQGYYPSKAPIGYKTIQEQSGKKVIVPDYPDAEYVKRIFESYVIGNYTFRTLADKMTSEGFFPNKKPCSKKTIENILHNDFYTGVFTFKGKKYYDAKHEPLISTELYQAVQDKIKSKLKTSPVKRTFAYSGFIKCDKCGHALVPERQTGHTGNGNYVYYRCHHCPKTTIREDVFEELFEKNILANIQFSDEDIKLIIESAKELIQSEYEYSTASLEEIHKRVQLLKRRLNQLYTDKADNLVDADTYIEKRNEWTNEIEKLNVKYNKLSQVGTEFVENIEMWSNLCKDALRLYRGQTAEEKRNLMNLVCSNPVFDGSNVTFTVYPAFAYALKSYNVEMVGLEPTSKMD